MPRCDFSSSSVAPLKRTAAPTAGSRLYRRPDTARSSVLLPLPGAPRISVLVPAANVAVTPASICTSSVPAREHGKATERTPRAKCWMRLAVWPDRLPTCCVAMRLSTETCSIKIAKVYPVCDVMQNRRSRSMTPFKRVPCGENPYVTLLTCAFMKILGGKFPNRSILAPASESTHGDTRPHTRRFSGSRNQRCTKQIYSPKEAFKNEKRVLIAIRK